MLDPSQPSGEPLPVCLPPLAYHAKFSSESPSLSFTYPVISTSLQSFGDCIYPFAAISLWSSVSILLGSYPDDVKVPNLTCVLVTLKLPSLFFVMEGGSDL